MDKTMKVIDMHTHVVPKGFIDQLGKKDFGAMVKEDERGKYISFSTGGRHPYSPCFYDMEARIKDMDEGHIDVQGISISPRLFYYEFPIETAAEVATICNDEIQKITEKYSDHFFPIGTVPLQDTKAAVKELKRISREYGFRSIQIGTEVNGKTIAESELIPFYEAVEEEGMTVLIHPFAYGEQKFMDKYYLNNFVGNPLYTTLAAAHLIFSGILEKFPGLRFVLCHGGGFLPYQIGRFDHGFEERREPKENIDRLPSYYYEKNFYFDTVLHNDKALKFLIDLAGSEKVMLGSDYPYDMADHFPYRTVSNLNLNNNDTAKLMYENTEKIFGLIR